MTLYNNQIDFNLIDREDNCILNDDTYHELPQWLKDKYYWHREYDDSMSGFFLFIKGELNMERFNYIDRSGEILLSEDEYIYLPQYLKDRYTWIPELYSNSFERWVLYKKGYYTIEYIDSVDKISLHESEYNILPDFIKNKHIWINESIEGYSFYTKESIELDRIIL
jgi:hypothetical protein